MNPVSNLERRIRLWLGIVMVGLVVSGATAIPLEGELRFLGERVGSSRSSSIGRWILKVRDGLIDTSDRYPFMAYGTDWLAFAHFVIAAAFIGPWRDPVKNRWVIDWGLIACFLVVAFALIMGQVRGIPLGWCVVDCSFGILAMWPLWRCRRDIIKLSEAREVA